MTIPRHAMHARLAGAVALYEREMGRTVSELRWKRGGVLSIDYAPDVAEELADEEEAGAFDWSGVPAIKRDGFTSIADTCNIGDWSPVTTWIPAEEPERPPAGVVTSVDPSSAKCGATIELSIGGNAPSWNEGERVEINVWWMGRGNPIVTILADVVVNWWAQDRPNGPKDWQARLTLARDLSLPGATDPKPNRSPLERLPGELIETAADRVARTTPLTSAAAMTAVRNFDAMVAICAGGNPLTADDLRAARAIDDRVRSGARNDYRGISR